jgi:hypothetical protein
MQSIPTSPLSYLDPLIGNRMPCGILDCEHQPPPPPYPPQMIFLFSHSSSTLGKFTMLISIFSFGFPLLIVAIHFHIFFPKMALAGFPFFPIFIVLDPDPLESEIIWESEPDP